MKLSMLRKTLLATVAGMAMTLSAGAQAETIPSFTLDPSVFGMPNTSGFEGNLITGVSSELLQTTMDGGHFGSGWMLINGFKQTMPNGQVKTLFSNTTGLGTYYNLYITFDLVDVPKDGTPNTPVSENKLTKLDFKFWVDRDLDTEFFESDIDLDTHVGTEATVGGDRSDDILLAYGDLIEGVAGFNSQGGAYLNSDQTFVVCTGAGTADHQGQVPTGALGARQSDCTSNLGSLFFKEPNPFYGIAYDEFNNTQSATIIDPETGLVAIQSQATGAIDFGNRVPEPGSLALLGLGMLGAGLNLRRRRK
jgi:hypothetical protein